MNDIDFNIAVGSKIKNRRNEMNMTMKELGEKVNLSEATIQRYEIGKIKGVDINLLIKISDVLEVSPAYLMGWENYENNILNVPTNKIPLIGTIAAGEPILAEQHIEEYIDLETATRADFCLRVKGNSMIGAGIKNGDIVFIRLQDDVDDGEIAAVLIDDSATLKRVFKLGTLIQLRSENPDIKPIILNGDKDVKILGKAVYRLTKV